MKARHGKNDEGRSWRRVSASDLPFLRELRESLRKMLAEARRMQAEETEPGMKLAAATVAAQVKDWYDNTGRRLDALERTAPAWRP